MMRPMKAVILAVGSELLGVDRLDTNSLKLTRVLERYGVELVGKAVAGDDEAEIAAEIGRRLGQGLLVLVTGGLGPTADDCTRAAAARALGRGLTIDEAQVERMRAMFASFGRKMPEVNRRQAELIDGAELLHNPAGTAPGQLVEVPSGGALFLFPGVPRELEALIGLHLEPWLEKKLGKEGGIERGVIKVACLPESVLEERIAPAYDRFGRADISVLASPSEIRIQFFARGTAAERAARLQEMTSCLTELAGSAVFTDREETTLESAVVEALIAAGATLSTAESCTGGGIATRITSVAGSSAAFAGGAVTYSNEMKTLMVGVPPQLFAEVGAVSREVASAMAEGARQRFGTTYGIAVSGIAGPGGGSPEKPVGTVHLALAGPGDGDLAHRQVRFPGDRERIRRMTEQLALEMLRRSLLGLPLPGEAK
jgi:nicotinamide-nucleotide amidase